VVFRRRAFEGRGRGGGGGAPWKVGGGGGIVAVLSLVGASISFGLGVCSVWEMIFFTNVRDKRV
jgi:hypothetical protein